MKRFKLAPDARSDLRDLLIRSRRDFGPAIQARYRSLIDQAFRDIRTDSQRLGVKADPEISDDLRLYHLRHSRGRVAAEHRIGRPRHFIVFRHDVELVQVIRILHDGMDLPAQLRRPDDS